MSEAKRGELNPGWKGGVKREAEIVRNGLEIKAWRKEVLTRDNYTCQECGAYGEWIQVHHIKEFAGYPELRFDVGNGKALCVVCHKATDSYGGKWKR